MKSNTELSKLIADKLGIKEDVGVRDFSLDMNGAWVLVEAILRAAALALGVKI